MEDKIKNLHKKGLSIQEIAYRTGVSIDLLESYFIKISRKNEISKSYINKKGKYVKIV